MVLSCGIVTLDATARRAYLVSWWVALLYKETEENAQPMLDLSTHTVVLSLHLALRHMVVDGNVTPYPNVRIIDE
jgi:hypothetical protein